MNPRTRAFWIVVLALGLFLWWAYSTGRLAAWLTPPSGTPIVTLPTRALPTAAASTPAPSGAATPAPSGAATPVPSGNRNLLLGNPSGAVHDPNQPTNYLIERPQYALSYNRDRGIPNWVSWQVTKQDLGDVQRSNIFMSDTTLPKGW
jgi:endonuclease G